LAWRDLTRERVGRRGSTTAIVLIIVAVVAVVVSLVLGAW
jgi:hypothetical protein